MNFLAVFTIEIFIDWLSFIQPLSGFNITPWNPQAAIHIFFLLQSRIYFYPIIIAGIVGNLIIRSNGIFSIGNLETILITLLYLVGSILLTKYLKVTKIIESGAEFLKFIIFSINIAFIHAIISTFLYFYIGKLSKNDIVISIITLMIGDTSGLIIISPLLFTFLIYGAKETFYNIFDNWLIIFCIVIITSFIYFLATSKQDNSLRFIYLIIIPICGAAFSFNFKNTMLLIVASQIMLAVAFLYRDTPLYRVAEIQMMILVISSVTIYVSMIIIERRELEKKAKMMATSRNLATIAGILLHEIAQPITALSTYSRIQLNDLNNNGALDKNKILYSAKNIDDEITRVREIFIKIKADISDRDEITTAQTNVTPLVKTIFNLLQPSAKLLNVEVKLNISNDVISVISASQNISIAFKNLLLNSIQSASKSIKKECTVELYKTSDLCFIDFIDSGEFISKENLNRIFNYGYSDSNSGMGIGLSIAKDLVEISNGNVIAYPNQKLKFRIILPTIHETRE